MFFKYRKHVTAQFYQTTSSFHFPYMNENCIKLIFSYFNGAAHFSQIKTGHYVKKTKEKTIYYLPSPRLRETLKLAAFWTLWKLPYKYITWNTPVVFVGLLWKFQSHFRKHFGTQHCHLLILEKWKLAVDKLMMPL